MEIMNLIASLGQEVEDAEEEAFLLFSQDIPSSNLGFIDSRSNSMDISIQGRDYTIRQSPTVLTSKRQGGTTGAVLWKITPLFAEWICSKDNIIWTSSVLSPDSTVVELGCGVSGLLALSLAPSIRHYIPTDQEYVQRILKENLEENMNAARPSGNRQSSNRSANNQRRSRKQGAATKHQHNSHSHSPSPLRNGGARNQPVSDGVGNVTFVALDWETDSPQTLKKAIPSDTSTGGSPHQSRSSSRTRNSQDAGDQDFGFDLVLACDCIYNDALVAPFLKTCADICRLRPVFSEAAGGDRESDEDMWKPTLCIIAQQLRSHEVFEEWIREALMEFRVWRVPDEVIGKELGDGSGYVVHALLLRDEFIN